MRKFQYPNCKLQTNTNNETLNTKQIQIHNFQNQYCIFRYCLEFRMLDYMVVISEIPIDPAHSEQHHNADPQGYQIQYSRGIGIFQAAGI